MEKNYKKEILIAGIGNLLLMDDGVGVHTVNELLKDPIPDVTIADIGTAILNGLCLFENAEKAILVDAMVCGNAPGSVYICEEKDVLKNRQNYSLHEMGVLNALQFLPEYERPSEIVIIGIEPEIIDYGMELTPSVQAAIPQVIAIIKKVTNEWKQRELKMGTDGLLSLSGYPKSKGD